MARTTDPGLWALATSDGTPFRAFRTAVIVGAALTAINQGDAILANGTVVWWKVCLTFCVPYLVATWGAVGAKRDALGAADEEPAEH